MRHRLVAAALLLVGSLTAPAGAWEEPARGTPLRADLLDAIRPHLEWSLGAPAVHHAIGATDVWYIDPELCSAWRVVICDVCP